MRKFLRVLAALTVAAWQVEMAVDVALATLPRNRKPKPAQQAAAPAPPACNGAICKPQQPPQQQPTNQSRVIVR